MKARTITAVLGGLLVPLIFAADDWELPLGEPQLKPARGVELVSANCQICHSADYITTQPPLNRTAWTASVQKMIDKYGAPLKTNQINEIVDYLVSTYGKK
jgi:sulfite dehydrogenase (cytochrome) subunit B